MSRYYSVLVITVVVINGLHCMLNYDLVPPPPPPPPPRQKTTKKYDRTTPFYELGNTNRSLFVKTTTTTTTTNNNKKQTTNSILDHSIPFVWNVTYLPYASLVDAASLNTRSTCKLSVISAVQVQSMKGGIWTAK